MNAVPAADWFGWLLSALRAVQLGLLAVIHALGLAGDSHGQPAWPWAHRLAGETLAIDLASARALAWSLVLAGIACVAAIVAVFWRRGRLVLLGLAAALVAFAPWPPSYVVFTAAYPTSFHVSTTGFGAQAIVHGQRLYARYCAECHGADGRGEGPGVARQPFPPPDLTGPLLARRADGELFWRIQSGMRGRDGRPTMPGFGGTLADGDTWALIDFLKALAAGQGASAGGTWPQPVAVPEAPLRCADGSTTRVADLRAKRQRLQIVAADAPPKLRPDPRLVTLLVLRTPLAAPTAGGGAAAGAARDAASAEGAAPAGVVTGGVATDRAPADGAAAGTADCVVASDAAWEAYAWIAGVPPERLAGTRFLADRDGWLRARALPGQVAWAEADLLCRAGPPASSAPSAPARPGGDGLGVLIARMDDEPVRFLKGGFVH